MQWIQKSSVIWNQIQLDLCIIRIWTDNIDFVGDKAK